MKLLVTRPAEEASGLARLLAAQGHTTLIEPLIEIRPVAGATLPLDGIAALLVTSANGARRLAALTRRRDLPIYAVGDRTEAAARAAGFVAVESAGGDAAALAALVRARRTPQQGMLLHVAGTARAGDLAGLLRAAGYGVRVAAVYDSVAAERFGEPALASLCSGALDGVLLFSPRTAERFAALLQEAGLAAVAERLDAWCLSRAVAAALAPLAFHRIHVAAQPTQASLLDALATAAPGPGGAEPGGRSLERNAARP